MESNVVDQDWKELLDRFTVRLHLVGIGTYTDSQDFHHLEVELTPLLKSELIKALELGVNVPDDEVVRLTLMLSSVRRSA